MTDQHFCVRLKVCWFIVTLSRLVQVTGLLLSKVLVEVSILIGP